MLIGEFAGERVIEDGSASIGDVFDYISTAFIEH